MAFPHRGRTAGTLLLLTGTPTAGLRTAKRGPSHESPSGLGEQRAAGPVRWGSFP